ncbi:MAG TPA: GGDEF domain-containing protein, partial [Syntrophorhabdaceae bacterium]|nr:GGDEF domain-containing protein [Syntrophorhabdaceae bacterium]
GDQVLKGITRTMKDNLRNIDRLGRYGGEEFLVILPETGLDKALVVAERLRAAIGSAVIDSGDDRIEVTVSAGLASYTPGRLEKDLIKEADDNLYRAKAEGKNRTYYEDFR